MYNKRINMNEQIYKFSFHTLTERCCLKYNNNTLLNNNKNNKKNKQRSEIT